MTIFIDLINPGIINPISDIIVLPYGMVLSCGLLLLYRLQEESDLKVAQDLFGTTCLLHKLLYLLSITSLSFCKGDAANSSETKGACSIDDMNPTDDEGFKQLREALVKKITRYEVTDSFNFCDCFMSEVLRD